jgi:hypothetical protein
MSGRENWCDEDLDMIWARGRSVRGYDPLEWRKDVCGAWVSGREHGNRQSPYGWEVDHIDGNPENNALSNLRPVHWKNNASGRCSVTSEHNRNVLAD